MLLISLQRQQEQESRQQLLSEEALVSKGEEVANAQAAQGVLTGYPTRSLVFLPLFARALS